MVGVGLGIGRCAARYFGAILGKEGGDFDFRRVEYCAVGLHRQGCSFTSRLV